MKEFLTLEMLANYTIFITLVAAATQFLKEPIDNITKKIFKTTISTNYVVFIVSFLLYFAREAITTGVSLELVLIGLCNAFIISFGSSGFHKLMQDKV